MTKKVVLGMKVVDKAVIKDLQNKLLVEDILLRALTSLNSLEQKAADSFQHCRVVASQTPSIQPGEEVKVGDEWTRYKEINVTQDDQSLSIDHFWKKCSPRKITGDKFEVLPKNGQMCFSAVPFKCRCLKAFKCQQKNADKAECVNEG